MQAAATLSQGLGGRDAAAAVSSGIPLSRQGARPVFTKLAASVAIGQPLPGQLRLALIGLGQISFGAPMLASEQFSLDGPDGVSAFADGTFSTDQGATLRAELSRPFAVSLGAIEARLSPYLFAAAGRGTNVRPTAAEPAHIEAAALGVGLRSALDTTPDTLSLDIELARQFSDVAGQKQGWRIDFSFLVTF